MLITSGQFLRHFLTFLYISSLRISLRSGSAASSRRNSAHPLEIPRHENSMKTQWKPNENSMKAQWTHSVFICFHLFLRRLRSLLQQLLVRCMWSGSARVAASGLFNGGISGTCRVFHVILAAIGVGVDLIYAVVHCLFKVIASWAGTDPHLMVRVYFFLSQ